MRKDDTTGPEGPGVCAGRERTSMGKAVADVGAANAGRTFIKKRGRKQVGRFTWYQGKPLQRIMIVRDDRRLGSTHVGFHLALGQTTHQWVVPQRRGAYRQGAMPIPRDEYREYIFDYSIQRTYEWVQALPLSTIGGSSAQVAGRVDSGTSNLMSRYPGGITW